MSEVNVVVGGKAEAEPTEQEVEFDSKGACFDSMSEDEKAAVVKSIGSVEKVKANPALNDC